jgi:Spy/CpxP family protein refolding chaperone
MMTARNTRAAAGGVLFVTLVAGFLLGLVWSRTSSAQAEPTAPTAVAAEEADEDRGGETRRRGLIVERVGLSAEQKVQVDSIMGLSRTMMRELRADYRTGYGELIESTRSSIKAVLTPEQAAEYDALLTDFDRRREMDDERERGRSRSEERDGERDRGQGDEERPRRDSGDGDGRERDRGQWSQHV